MENSEKLLGDSSILSEDIIIQRILLGEKELFELLLRRYNQLLYRVIRGYLASDDDIMDTMQETYLKAFQKLEQYKGGAAFSTWLIRIGINEALGFLRKEKRKQSHFVSNSDQTNTLILQFADPNNMNPEKKTMEHESRYFVEQAIDQLPEKYKLIYILKEVEGLDHNAIADCLELSVSNVKVRLHRAKEMLKNTMLHLSTSHAAVFEFGNKRCDKVVEFVMGKIVE